MPLRVKVRVSDDSLKNLRRTLDAIDRRLATAAVRGGINAATKRILAAAKSKVPERHGQLRKSLGRKVKVYRYSRVVVGIVGVRRGFKVQVDGVNVDPARYGHLVEYGRAGVTAKPGSVLSSANTAVAPDQPTVFGKHVGPVPPHPFLRPAWEEHKRYAVEEIKRRLRDALRGKLGGGVSYETLEAIERAA